MSAPMADWRFDADGKLTDLRITDCNVSLLAHDAGGYLLNVYTPGHPSEPCLTLDFRGTCQIRTASVPLS